jgi:hypothetical protein
VYVSYQFVKINLFPASLVAPDNRRDLGQIISDFYQIYVSTFGRSVYFNPDVNGTPVYGSLSALSSRVFMARINAITTCVLLFLLASLLSVTLVTQPRPKPDGDAVVLAGNTVGIHAWMASAELVEVMRKVSHLPSI